MKLFFQPYFILAVTLYIVIRLCRVYDFVLPEIVNSHLTDLLFMPILLTISLVGVRVLKRDEAIHLTKGMIVIAYIFVSIVFELIMPSRSILFVQDIGDIIAYGLGTIAFFLIQKRERELKELF